MSTETTGTAPVAQKAEDEKPATAVDEKAVTASAKLGERERIQAILSLPEAENRQTLAQHIALSTDTDVESARSLLIASPEEAKAAQPDLMSQMQGMDAGVDYGATSAKVELPTLSADECVQRRKQDVRNYLNGKTVQ
jgi:hypothetical protein